MRAPLSCRWLWAQRRRQRCSLWSGGQSRWRVLPVADSDLGTKDFAAKLRRTLLIVPHVPPRALVRVEEDVLESSFGDGVLDRAAEAGFGYPDVVGAAPAVIGCADAFAVRDRVAQPGEVGEPPLKVAHRLRVLLALVSPDASAASAAVSGRSAERAWRWCIHLSPASSRTSN